MRRMNRAGALLALALALCASSVRAQGSDQAKPKGPSEIILGQWNYIGGKLLAMADDWPESKYSYRPNDKVRTFQQVLLHVAGSNNGLLHQVTGKSFGNEKNDPAVDEFKTKAETVGFFKKTISDGAAVIRQQGDAGTMKHLDDWVGYIEHMGEHYGLLVAYYRNNGVVPPDSRPKK